MTVNHRGTYEIYPYFWNMIFVWLLPIGLTNDT
jgi:hypothetical protein